jgi:hypothetical protein
MNVPKHANRLDFTLFMLASLGQAEEPGRAAAVGQAMLDDDFT